MKILAIGDVVGSIGCHFLRSRLPAIKKSKGIDLVIANGENSANGNGVTPSSADYLFSSGVDIITTGNHSFRRRESYPYYDSAPYILRPANFPEKTTPGRGMLIYDMGRIQVCVINLMGCVYLENLRDPYDVMDELLKKNTAKITILDFHAEATAEKLAMAYYLDGKISAMFGTHTHVQTADECIFESGMGYITDVGMTGPIRSVLGVKPELAIKKQREKLPLRFETADGDCKLDCILFDIDEKSGKTVGVERMEIK